METTHIFVAMDSTVLLRVLKLGSLFVSQFEIKKIGKVLFVLFLSCSTPKQKIQGSSSLFKTVEFGGCEYYQIEYGIGEGRVFKLLHKDDCKNHVEL